MLHNSKKKTQQQLLLNLFLNIMISFFIANILKTLFNYLISSDSDEFSLGGVIFQFE